jgi:toxin-antitoxin system PIN domain toxin
MILADTNFWLALSLSKHEFHKTARDWFGGQSAVKPVLFCRATQQSFLRLLTTEGLMRYYGIPPMSNAAAWGIYDALHSDRRSGFAAEPAAVEKRWKRFAERPSASPKLWMDAYLAAFAVAGSHTLVTTDQAFRQFDGLDAIVLAKS